MFFIWFHGKSLKIPLNTVWKNEKFTAMQIFGARFFLVLFSTLWFDFTEKVLKFHYIFKLAFNLIWQKKIVKLSHKTCFEVDFTEKYLKFRKNCFQFDLTKNSWNWVTKLTTVWKSHQKSDHAEKFFVKSHSKNLLNLLLQMQGFLSLGDVFGSFGLNTIWRQAYFLEFLVNRNNFWM